MKRDWDLVRKLLLEVESLAPGVELAPIDGDWIEAEHMALIIEVGYCEGPLERSVNGLPYVAINRLTWSGHEFLNTIRDDSIWNHVKTKFRDTLTGAPSSLVISLATHFAKQALGNIV